MEEALIKRILPHSVEAERSVLGSMLMDQEAVQTVSELITRDDFYQYQYGVIFEAMVELHQEGKAVDLVTVQDRLRGKDVPPERIVEEAVKRHVPLVGLSALMTTTVPSMEETIRRLRKEASWVKVMVGGAVLTKEYADTIGADAYCRDAMASVHYAETVIG